MSTRNPSKPQPSTFQAAYFDTEVNKCYDVTGSGELEFEEFVTLASRFMVEEDAEAMQQELKEAFRLYDKEGNSELDNYVFSLQGQLVNQRLQYDSGIVAELLSVTRLGF